MLGATADVPSAALLAALTLAVAAVVNVGRQAARPFGAGAVHLAVVAGLALAAATLAYVTQGYLVAGGVVPVALLAYWVCNSAWTMGQSVVIRRWFPVPA